MGPLGGSDLERLKRELNSEWKVVEGKRLERKYKFKDFKAALDFTNRLGELAEQEGHHPDLGLGWGYVNVQLWTHSAGGLTESDFIMAAKVDRI